MSSYIELHAASAFSFLQGASLPETLVDRAAALGYPALALLDRDGVYGAPRFHRAATSVGMQPIVGAELTMGRRLQATGCRLQAASGEVDAGTETASEPGAWSLGRTGSFPSSSSPRRATVT